MKKMTFLACATLLTSMIALNSCKSDEPGGNPNLNDGEVVKTEFAISFPNQAVGPNKMAAATVQTNGLGNFQGITGIYLVPFAGQDSIIGTEARLGANIHLAEDLTKANIESKKSKAKLYPDVAVPLTTGSFLFYAKSAATGDKNAVGSLVLADTAKANPADFKFQLDSILIPANQTTLNTKAGQLMTQLSNVANVNDGKGKTWKEYTADSAALKAIYDTYITMTALSTFEISRVWTDLYNSLKPRQATSPLAAAIITEILQPSWTSLVNDTIKLTGDYANFPAEFGIPEGCVMTKWNAGTDAFESGDYTGKALPTKFVYPAQLWYTANSTIVTANKSMKDSYDSTTKYWKDILKDYTDLGAPVAVNTLTRSVAIVDTVQYAVARFDVQVKLAANNLHDNSTAADSIVDCSAGFPVTAVLIGGQNHVGYDFKPAAAGGYTIYDNVMDNANMKATTSYSDLNYTLLLESVKDQDVRIAIEMVNTARDFYGYNGQLVPKNGKFYVVAELKHDNAGTGSIQAKMEGKVFKQDFTTIAKLNLKDLKKAYNTIPDLRTPQLEIGFAVDLTWQDGHVYEIDFE